MAKRKVKRLAVIDAVEAGDVARLREVVAAGADVHAMEDTSPLARAIELGNGQVIEALLELGTNPDLGGMETPLAVAAGGGDEKLVKRLLDAGADVDALCEEDVTPLMYAAHGGHVKVMKLLIDRGADVKKTDREGGDALEFAVRGKQVEAIEFLLPYASKKQQEAVKRRMHLVRDAKPKTAATATVEISKTNTGGRLVKAQQRSDAKLVKELIAKGADVNETNAEGTSVLALACAARQEEIVQALLAAGADPNRDRRFPPLDVATGYGRLDIVEMLLAAGAGVNARDADGGTALMSAAADGNPELVSMLLDAGADPDAEDDQGHSALWYARQRRNREAEAMLRPLTANAEAADRPWRSDKEGKSLELRFLAAAGGGDLKYVRKFLADGVAVDVADVSFNTALHLAAERGHMEVVEELLKAGAPIDAPGCADRTPLLAAAAYGQVAVARRLVAAGADPRYVAGDGGRNGLHLSADSTGNVELIELFVKGGADVNAREEPTGITPLHVAAQSRRPDLIEGLVREGADVHACDGQKWTPLMMAAMRADVATVQQLIKLGARLEDKDGSGKTAYDLAKSWGDREVAEYLKSQAK